jgi:two-component system NtrC family sensor kinase
MQSRRSQSNERVSRKFAFVGFHASRLLLSMETGNRDWLHLISDALIALAYFSIPVTLIYFIRKRRDLPFNWMFVSFGIFILACSGTHAMEMWTLWHGTYWLSGAVKAVAAMASLPTAMLLVQLVPRMLALSSPTALRLEIVERKRAEEALHQANSELEMNVLERCPSPKCKSV